MNHDIKLTAARTDLPSQEMGFTGQGYIYLNNDIKIVVPPESVEFLDHLATAAASLSQRMRNETKKVEPVELKHPGTWLPGDQIIASNGSVYERLANGEWLGHDTQLVGFSDDGHADRHLHRNDSARITHLVPRVNVKVPA